MLTESLDCSETARLFTMQNGQVIILVREERPNIRSMNCRNGKSSSQNKLVLSMEDVVISVGREQERELKGLNEKSVLN